MIYCRKTVSDSNKVCRPYFIFTSRIQECFSGVPSLHLDVLTPKDAVQLIQNQVQGLTPGDAESLAELVQYFPLTLWQTISYIHEQQEIKRVTKEQYNIQNYLKEFVEEKEKILDHHFSDDFGDIYKKTTFNTFNVTLNAIKSEKQNGDNAIMILQLLAYLYADKIDSKMFVSLFSENFECGAKAILLLEKYSMITKVSDSFYKIHRLVQEVIQLKFKEYEVTILEKTMKLIDPQLFKCYFEENKPYGSRQLMEKCSVDQFLHYNNLQSHIQKYEDLKKKCEWFFNHLHDRVLLNAAFHDDLEKIKQLKVSKQELMKLGKNNIEELMHKQSNKVIKYILENDLLEITYRIGKGPNFSTLLQLCVRGNNVQIFKFLIEKGADFSMFLHFATLKIISGIIEGKADSYINLQNNINIISVEILEECLFFATLFNNDSIVKLLLDAGVKPCYEFKTHRKGKWFRSHNTTIAIYKHENWSPTLVAAIFGYKTILKMLLTVCDRDQLKIIIFQLLDDKYFNDKEIFKMVFSRYCDLVDIDKKNDEIESFLCIVKDEDRYSNPQHRRTLWKQDAYPFLSNPKFEIIVQFLYDNGGSDISCSLQNIEVLLSVENSFKRKINDNK